MTKQFIIKATFIFSLMTLILMPFPSAAQKKNDSTKIIYVPAYSSIYHGNRDRVINLAVTLSIRNVDSNSNITLSSIEYFNNTGKFVRSYLDSEKILKPFETMNIIIKEADTQGGSTPAFIVKWSADSGVNDLFVESVMIGTYPQGISFTSRGIIIKK